jgi:hypothetical protein
VTGRRDDPPIAGYDQLPIGSLEHRIRSLDAGEVETLKRHERDHADRTAVLRMLDAQLDRLSSGAAPSPGGSGEPLPPEPPRGGSKVSPQTTAQPLSPPPHGTPDQPGKPKADRP